jgi:hypothetical protein
MKVFWLNDALTIKSENVEERHSLAVLLRGLADPTAYDDIETDSDAVIEEHSDRAISP